MEPKKFDEIIKRAADTRLTRLDALRGLVAGAAAAVTGAAIASGDADAKNKGKSGKKGKNGKKGNGKKGNGVKGGGSVATTTTTKAPATTTTTSAPATTTTARQCKGEGQDCKGNCAEKCCSGCADEKGYKCGVCPTTTTTTSAPATTTTTAKQCKGEGEDCKGNCAEKCCSGCADEKGYKCGVCPTTTTTTSAPATTTTTKAPEICQHSNPQNPKYGCKNVCTETCKGYECEEICGDKDACPVGQGGGNPCKSDKYCKKSCFDNSKGYCKFVC